MTTGFFTTPTAFNGQTNGMFRPANSTTSFGLTQGQSPFGMFGAGQSFAELGNTGQSAFNGGFTPFLSPSQFAGSSTMTAQKNGLAAPQMNFNGFEESIGGEGSPEGPNGSMGDTGSAVDTNIGDFMGHVGLATGFLGNPAGFVDIAVNAMTGKTIGQNLGVPTLEDLFSSIFGLDAPTTDYGGDTGYGGGGTDVDSSGIGNTDGSDPGTPASDAAMGHGEGGEGGGGGPSGGPGGDDGGVGGDTGDGGPSGGVGDGDTDGQGGDWAYGGHVTGPGGPREDRIPAHLSNGEYVVDAETVRAFGPEMFAAMQRMGQGFAPRRGYQNGMARQAR